MPAAPDTKPPSPISLRLDTAQQKTLVALTQGCSASDVLRQGLTLLANTEISSSEPLYPRLVDAPDIDEVIERATSAACEVLDSLFVSGSPERFGISSNFQGTLKEHIVALLTGKVGARFSHARKINALFGDWTSLGRVRPAEQLEGYCLVQAPMRRGGAAVYFHSDRKKFLPLESISADTLYTSHETALEEAFKWMAKEGLSPREARLKLCLLSFKGDGPLQVAAVAD